MRPRRVQLQQLAFDHVLSEVDENIENLEIALAQGHFKGLHVKPVPCKHAHMIAPASIGAGATTASVGTVDHVVVNKGGAVDQLDDGAEADGAGSAISGGARGEKQQSRAQALSSTRA